MAAMRHGQLVVAILATVVAVAAFVLVLATRFAPQWLAVAVLADVVASVMAWFWIIRPYQIREKRLDEGLCEACGYDLRATPARCPQCGAVAITPH